MLVTLQSKAGQVFVVSGGLPTVGVEKWALLHRGQRAEAQGSQGDPSACAEGEAFHVWSVVGNVTQERDVEAYFIIHFSAHAYTCWKGAFWEPEWTARITERSLSVWS